MRLALVITELHPGGAEKCFVRLAGYLRERGHQVQVWQLWPAPPPGKEQLVHQLDQWGIPWASGNATRPWHFWRATRWLQRELRAFQPDVVQTFLFHANLAGALARTGQHYRLMGGARVSQPQWWRQRLQRWASRRMEKLICVSQSVADHIRQREGVSAEKLLVIPNALDQATLAWANAGSVGVGQSPAVDGWSQLGLPPTARVLLYVGRLTSQKGIYEFLRQSAERLLRRLPEHHLVLMGAGEQEPLLRGWLKDRTVSQRVHVVGWQPDAVQWMRRADLLLLPALYEGMPNVVLEAMAVGIPVASFEVDGLREMLGGEANAATNISQRQPPVADLQLAPPHDYAGLEERIAQLANSDELRRRCGTENRQRVEREFQLEDQLAKYEQLYLAVRR